MNARVLLALPCLLFPALAGCGNPALDVKIATYDDDELVPSQYHRKGQPCVDCHGAYKGAYPEIVIGGTVFDGENSDTPVKGVKIFITDARSNINAAKDPVTRDIVTNCNGNFYLTHDDVFEGLGYDTVPFPLFVSVKCPDGSEVPMNSRISREGSCNACHTKGHSPGSPGRIYCSGGSPPTPESCPQAFPQ